MTKLLTDLAVALAALLAVGPIGGCLNTAVGGSDVVETTDGGDVAN